MEIRLWLPFLLSCVFSFTGETASATNPRLTTSHEKVLVTTFDPFGGSSANNSQAIGAVLKAHPEWIGSDTKVVLCNLPVAYGKAPEQALDCIQKEKPSMVVSLGEAGCHLRVESAANNSDDTPGFPDNAGQVRNGQEIIESAPRRLGFGFPVEAMMCAIDPSGTSGIEASVTPGNFVCNNLAYTLTYHLHPRGIPFTFIHVPNSQCSDKDKDAAANAKRIAMALAAAQKALAAPSATENLWRSMDSRQRMPSSAPDLSTLEQKLRSAGAGACEITYSRRLLQAYCAFRDCVRERESGSSPNPTSFLMESSSAAF